MPIFLGSQLVETFGGTKNITGGVSLQEKTVELSENYQTVVADGQYDGLSKVNIPGISSNYIGSGIKRKSAQQYTPNNATQTIVGGQYLAGDQVINPVPTETKNITTNGTYTPSSGKYFSSVEVNIEGQVSSNLQDSKSVTPSASTINVLPDSGYGGLAKVVVNPVPTETKTASKNGDVTPSTGKFLSKVTVNVQPTLETLTITPSETLQEKTPTTGVDGFSKVTVSAITNTYVGSGITKRSSTDLTVSGQTVTVPSGYYSSQATKSVASGAITISTPTISSAGLVTASATVTAGYVSSNPTSKTLQLITQGAKTITPSSSQQTAVAKGVYTTGNVVVSAVPTETTTINENGTFTPSTGKYFNSVTVEIPIQHYYTGNASPSSSLGVDGDIYLKV